jgi:hypothetical protein
MLLTRREGLMTGAALLAGASWGLGTRSARAGIAGGEHKEAIDKVLARR